MKEPLCKKSCNKENKNFEYESNSDTDAGIRFPSEKMSFDIAEKAMLEAIKVIKSNGNNELSIEFFGGEPLLNYKMIMEVLNKFKSGEDYGINIYYGVTTNGTYIADEIIELFHKYDVSVAISIDYIDYETGTFRGEGVCSGNCAGAVENQYNDIRKMDYNYCKTVRGIISFLLEDYLNTISIEELKE